jgi:hypothetical protein
MGREYGSRAVAALAVTAAAVAGCGGTEGADRVEVMEMQVTTDQYTTPDLDPPGPSLGDLYVYSGHAVQDGSRVGQGGGTCQVIQVDGEQITTQCVLTIELERGSLTAQALWVTGASPLDMAITGGTGDYREARGTARFWDIATPQERARFEVIY